MIISKVIRSDKEFCLVQMQVPNELMLLNYSIVLMLYPVVLYNKTDNHLFQYDMCYMLFLLINL